jgi:methanogenic corrinoid protein MtbC1
MTAWGEVIEGDPVSLRRACRAAVADGVPLVELVRDVLTPFQRTLGEQWLHGERSVASEHEVTAAVDRIVVELELGLGEARPLVPVICVSAEGDWHGLAGRLVALALSAEGHRTAYLGASLPASALGGAVRSLGEDGVVAITCSTVAALPGAAKSVAAVAAAGCPAVVGGYAFDAVPEAAARLAVGTAPQASHASLEVLSALVPGPVHPLLLGTVDQLDLVAPSVIARAAGSLIGRAPTADCVEVTTYALGLLRAAVCFDLPVVLSRHTSWLRTWLTARRLLLTPADIFSAMAVAIRGLLPEPDSDALLRILEDA